MQRHPLEELIVDIDIIFMDIAAHYMPGACIDITHSVITILVSLCTFRDIA